MSDTPEVMAPADVLKVLDTQMQYAIGSDHEFAEKELADLRAARAAVTKLQAAGTALLDSAPAQDVPPKREGARGVQGAEARARSPGEPQWLTRQAPLRPKPRRWTLT